ncbi:MAG: L,D-transpeptidase [Salegentibacter sp.]
MSGILSILKRKKLTPILGMLSCLLLFSCLPEAEKTNKPILQNKVNDSIPDFQNVNVEKIKKDKRLEINYHIDSLNTKAELDSFNSRFSKEQKNTLYALNRVDGYRVGVKDVMVVPDTLTSDLAVYSPFPKNLEILDSIPKALLINQRVQAFGLYESGKLLRWGPVSSGKQSTPTPNGLYYGNYKAKRKISTINGSWVMPYYFNFMNFDGVGTHQYTLPGFPASHACVRMFREDAKFIYEWADMWQLDGNQLAKNGTPFMVFGKYDFEHPSPWLQLSEDMKANDLSEEEMQTLREYVKKYKDDPKNFTKPAEEEEPEPIA